MTAIVSGVARTAPWPGRAWSECPWVMTARATARDGSIWNPPGSQWSPARSGLSQVSNPFASAMGGSCGYCRWPALYGVSIEQVGGAEDLELGDLGLPGRNDGRTAAAVVEHAIEALGPADGIEHREVREQWRNALGPRLRRQLGQHMHAGFQRLEPPDIRDDHPHPAQRLALETRVRRDVGDRPRREIGTFEPHAGKS